MEELSNKLVLTLLVLIILSTIISTIAFMSYDNTIVVRPPPSTQAGGKATITILGDSEPVMATGKAVLKIIDSET